MVKNEESSILTFLREDEQTTRTERLYERMKQMIVTGVLPSGYSFPNENEMCKQLQLGRGTLREAYQALTADKLILRQGRTGTVVNSKDDIILNAPFSVAACYANFQDLFEFRVMLEAENAKNAASKATDEELEEIGKLIEKFAGEKTPEKRQELDLEFHKMIATCSHNPLLINVFSVVWNSFQNLLTDNYRNVEDRGPSALTDATVQHQAIYDALVKRDRSQAYEAMRLHMYGVYAWRLGQDSE